MTSGENVESRLGWVGTIVALAVGALLAVVAARVATGVLSDTGTFRARAVIAVAPDERFQPGPDDRGPRWDKRMARFVEKGAPAQAAAAILSDSGFASAVTSPVTGATVSAKATPASITLTVTAGSAADAERAAQALLDKGMPVAEQKIGPVRLTVGQPPAGTATPTGLPTETVVATAAPIGYLLGVLLVLVARSTALHLRRRRPA
ncbi:hypothetical protein ACQEVB_11120 [Pseudonocardia sp. CA-107938]|uniref:hypothetical protein n=1 Tax=Pseudonocardia sp. CA-107938 TaxID=3240021 RepID=UPI003D9199C1